METVVVPDVFEFPGHISCDADSRSEIVVPILFDGEVCRAFSTETATHSNGVFRPSPLSMSIALSPLDSTMWIRNIWSNWRNSYQRVAIGKMATDIMIYASMSICLVWKKVHVLDRCVYVGFVSLAMLYEDRLYLFFFNPNELF